MVDYRRSSLDDIEPVPDKPGKRYEVSPALELSGYNFNVVKLAGGERLPESGLHYHEAQEEFFYLASGRCRVEVEHGSFDLDEDGMAVFPAGVAQCVHNPFDEPCKLIAIGYPPEGHETGRQVQPWTDLLADRYPDRCE